jgi:hypothetical protein
MDDGQMPDVRSDSTATQSPELSDAMTPEQIIADALYEDYWPGDEARETVERLGVMAAAALRAKGLLPGPDDIVVSREALTELWDAWRFKRSVLSIETGRAIPAALSQPHPAQEQP